jgi:hypothetical protein
MHDRDALAVAVEIADAMACCAELPAADDPEGAGRP